MDAPKHIRHNITFDDLPLLQAIAQLFNDPSFVRSEVLLISDEGREWTLQQVISHLPHQIVGKYRFERILLLVNQFRKLNKDHLHKRLLILEHAMKMNTPECFYRGKLSTECSDGVDLDRIKPDKRGGKYTVENTVLSCSRHNRARGCKEVELFWKQ